MKQFQTRMPDVISAFAELRPRTLQSNVRALDDGLNALRCLVRLDGVKLSTIVEVECIDGELWAHLSVCSQSPARVPSWAELRWCKEYFLGDRKAVQILPARAEYVNVHPHVLHLYAPLERDPLPDFRGIDTNGQLSI